MFGRPAFLSAAPAEPSAVPTTAPAAPHERLRRKRRRLNRFIGQTSDSLRPGSVAPEGRDVLLSVRNHPLIIRRSVRPDKQPERPVADPDA